MTKEEKIKEVYGENYNPHNIDENGWMKYSLWMHFFKKVDDDYDEFDNRNMVVRPKSLQGIENNNAWIELIKNENIPSGYYWILYSNSDTPKMGISNGFSITQANLGLGLHPVIEITHYQPIIEPYLPLY